MSSDPRPFDCRTQPRVPSTNVVVLIVETFIETASLLRESESVKAHPDGTR
jgi:hypothetical protein